MISIDELCEQLDILPPLEQSTCIGYSQRKPSCGCLVALSSRESATRAIQDVSFGLVAGRQAQAIELQKIAELLLCRRFHQFQSNGVAERWQHALQGWAPQSPQRQLSETTTTSTNVSAASPSRVELGVRQLSNSAFIAEFKRRIANDPSVIASLLVPASHTPVSASNLERSPLPVAAPISFPEAHPSDQQDAPIEAITISSPTRTGTTRDIGPTALEITRVEVSSDATEPVSTTNSTSRTNNSSVSDDSAVLADFSSGLDVSDRSQAIVRHSHVECAICCENYNEDNEEDCWECRTCQNRTHNECFRAWSEVAGNENIRCVFCRATV